MKKLLPIILLALTLTGCSFSFKKPVSVDSEIKSIADNWQKVHDISYTVHIVKQKEQSGATIAGDFKIFVKDKTKSRIEIEQDGKQAVFVNDPAKKLSFIYFPESKLYYQTNAFADGAASQNLNLTQRLDDIYSQLGSAFKVDGKETINGQPAIILKTKSDAGAIEKIWIREEDSVPLKFQNYDVSGELIYDLEFQNISTETLSDDLFVLPADAKSSSLDDLLKNYKAVKP